MRLLPLGVLIALTLCAGCATLDQDSASSVEATVADLRSLSGVASANGHVDEENSYSRPDVTILLQREAGTDELEEVLDEVADLGDSEVTIRRGTAEQSPALVLADSGDEYDAHALAVGFLAAEELLADYNKDYRGEDSVWSMNQLGQVDGVRLDWAAKRVDGAGMADIPGWMFAGRATTEPLTAETVELWRRVDAVDALLPKGAHAGFSEVIPQRQPGEAIKDPTGAMLVSYAFEFEPLAVGPEFTPQAYSDRLRPALSELAAVAKELGKGTILQVVTRTVEGREFPNNGQNDHALFSVVVGGKPRTADQVSDSMYDYHFAEWTAWAEALVS